MVLRILILCLLFASSVLAQDFVPGANTIPLFLGKPGGGAPGSLGDIGDVDLSGQADEDVLAWDAGAGSWISSPRLTNLEAAAADHVVGPASSTLDSVPAYADGTGKLIKNSAVGVGFLGSEAIIMDNAGLPVSLRVTANQNLAVTFNGDGGAANTYALRDETSAFTYQSISGLGTHQLRAGSGNNLHLVSGDGSLMYSMNDVLGLWFHDQVPSIGSNASLGNTGARWLNGFFQELFTGASTGSQAVLNFDTTLAGNGQLLYDTNFPGLGAGFRMVSDAAENLFFVRNINGNGGRVAFYPYFNFNTDPISVEHRRLQFGFGNVGNTARGFDFFNGPVGGLPTLPSPFNDQKDGAVLASGQNDYGNIYVGTVNNVLGAVTAGGGKYNGQLGRVAFAARDGAFLGTSAAAVFALSPTSTTFTCNDADNSVGGGPGTGDDRCIDPDHQLQVYYNFLKFAGGAGSLNNVNSSNRPVTIGWSRRMDGYPASNPDTPTHYVNPDHSMWVVEASGIDMPFGPLVIGRGTGSNSNGISGGFVQYSATDPVVLISPSSDITEGNNRFNWIADFVWGTVASNVRFGAVKNGTGVAPYLRSTVPVQAPQYRSGEQSITAGTTAVTALFVYGDSSGGAVTAQLPPCDTNHQGDVYNVKLAIEDGASANDLTVLPDGTDTIDGGASFVLTTLHDSVQLRCRSAASDWEEH